MKAYQIIIKGDVQRVGFRYFAKHKAVLLGLDGFVRNRSDGSVEIVAVGEKEKTDKLIGWCKKGPPLARVDSVDVEEIETDEVFEGFEVRY